jgi:glycosyltransferase involved in cell wall biosynthesis
MTKKALLVCYRFPPQGGGGVQRTLKYTKYLRAFGWEPVVHTARDPYWPVWDESLLAEIPAGVKVYRTTAFEFERFEQRVGAALNRRRAASRGGGGTHPAGAGETPRVSKAETPGGVPAVHGAPAPDRAEPTAGKGTGGASGGLRRFVHRRVLIPDPQIAWLPGAFVAGLRIARREGVRLLYTSSPPNSVQLLGGLLAGALKIPWVADFRDPWTDGPRRQRSYVGNSTRARLEAAAERWVMRQARRVIVSAPPLRDRFLEKYAFLDPRNVEVLTNGYDPADFAAPAGATPVLEPGRFHLTGTGNIEAMFDARPLLRAIADATAEDAGLRENLLVNLVGAKQGKYDADIAALGLGAHVRYPGWVPHARSLQYLRESDVLLMCQLTQPGGGAEKLSGKCFEYLYVRKPVLCLSVPGITADLLADAGLGTVVDPADKDGIKAALKMCYAERGRTHAGNPDVIARFDRRRLTERLAAIFDDVAGPGIDASLAARDETRTGLARGTG